VDDTFVPQLLYKKGDLGRKYKKMAESVEETTKGAITKEFFSKCRKKIGSEFTNLIFMDPCIVDYLVEIPTRCSFVIEFIIPKFIELNAQHVRAAHRSSSGALNCICSFWFIYPYGDRTLPRLSGK
jgi:hypothetical protein